MQNNRKHIYSEVSKLFNKFSSEVFVNDIPAS